MSTSALSILRLVGMMCKNIILFFMLFVKNAFSLQLLLTLN